MTPKLIGLTGKMGSGKNTVLERMQVLRPGIYEQASFAAALKQSAAALLGISVEKIEELKRDDSWRIVLGEYGKMDSMVGEGLTMRAFLQRAGTEAGRDIHGENVWVDLAMREIENRRRHHAMMRVGPYSFVFTDARFPNEAHAIIAFGGEIWRVVGPDDDTGTHASEAGLPDSMITHTIDNTVREICGMNGNAAGAVGLAPDFTRLDAQIVELIR